jgi:hypothetical protein
MGERVENIVPRVPGRGTNSHSAAGSFKSGTVGHYNKRSGGKLCRSYVCV